jgi:hypothetical protein
MAARASPRGRGSYRFCPSPARLLLLVVLLAAASFLAFVASRPTSVLLLSRGWAGTRARGRGAHLLFPPASSSSSTSSITPPSASSMPVGEIFFPDGTMRKVALPPHREAWWRRRFGNGRWHAPLLSLLRLYLDAEVGDGGSRQPLFHSYVGVGEWIGPTALLAGGRGGVLGAERAHRVERVLALEPDPACAAELAANVALNPTIAAVTDVAALCVAAEEGTRTLTGGACMSTSVVEGVSPPLGERKGETGRGKGEADGASVRCLPLPTVLSDYGLLSSRGFFLGLSAPSAAAGIFVKIDVEGAEWSILPSLLPWLRGLREERGDDGEPALPTFLVSFHPAAETKEAALDAVVKVAALFRYGAIVGGLEGEGEGENEEEAAAAPASPARPVTTQASVGITLDALRACGHCDVLLSDVRPGG